MINWLVSLFTKCIIMTKEKKSEDAILRQKAEELLEKLLTAEELLKASELRYRRLFESAKDGILILDAETGMITDVNPFLIEMLGYSESQFRDKAIWEIGFFRDLIANHDKFLELQQNKYVRYDDLPLETADGRKISVEFVSNSYFEDKKKVIQCNIREITKRKDEALALRNSESHLRTLVQTIPDLIWLKDSEGVYLSCNTRFERFFGAREADIIGKTDYDFVDRDLADFFRENDRKAMAAGKPTSNEEWVTFAEDGHREFLDTIKTPMYDFNGKLIGVLGIGRDNTQRKLAEQNVRASEKRFRAIFDQAPVAIALLDMQGRPIISNLSLSKMLGYTTDELSKMMFTEFTYPEDIDKDMIQFAALIDGKISGYSMEKRYIHKNGNLIWANLFVTTLNDTNGLPQEIIGMVEDITEQKQAEEKLINSEERFKILFDYAPDAYYLSDLKGTFIDGNIAAVKMLGYNKIELIGKSFFKLKLISPIQLLKATLLLAKNLLGKATGPDEFVINQKNGSKITVEISTYPVKIQDQSIVLGIARDITERKQAEKEIAMLAHSLKSISECVSITDLENKILFVNESFIKTYGYELNELIGKDISMVRSQSNEPAQLDEILPATIQGEWHGELMNRKKDGTEFPVYLSTTKIKVKEKVLGLIGVASDITERKLAETELIIAKEKAQESDRLKSAFLANMSHEVRTPLNSIIGFSGLLADPDFDEDQKNEFIQHIISNSNNLLTIISDIMDISKLESGDFKIRKGQINVQKFISTVREQYAFQAKENGLELKLVLPENTEETIIVADVERLRQIFNNLMSNALKFTANGRIEIGYQPRGKMVEFFVKDTGIGIQPEYHDKIFERFRQVDTEITRKFGGNGLGLAITKNLIELMGGKIWLESQPGKGSVFSFTLPNSLEPK